MKGAPQTVQLFGVERDFKSRKLLVRSATAIVRKATYRLDHGEDWLGFRRVIPKDHRIVHHSAEEAVKAYVERYQRRVKSLADDLAQAQIMLGEAIALREEYVRRARQESR